MTHIIAEPCIGTKDTACVDVCPVDCIHTTDDDKQFYIDPEICIDCEACVPVCPVEAIFEELDVPDRYKDYIRINAEEAKKRPQIVNLKEPLPGARTLEEIKKEEEAEGAAAGSS